VRRTSQCEIKYNTAVRRIGKSLLRNTDSFLVCGKIQKSPEKLSTQCDPCSAPFETLCEYFPKSLSQARTNTSVPDQELPLLFLPPRNDACTGASASSCDGTTEVFHWRNSHILYPLFIMVLKMLVTEIF
jgi:hypothetical protein